MANNKNKVRPALTLESNENNLIYLATKLAEKQLVEGTASSQVITHYLKLGTVRAQLEKEKLARENELLKAKTEAIKSAEKSEELFAEAIKAMRTYSGVKKDEDEIDDEDPDDEDEDDDDPDDEDGKLIYDGSEELPV